MEKFAVLNYQVITLHIVNYLHPDNNLVFAGWIFCAVRRKSNAECKPFEGCRLPK